MESGRGFRPRIGPPPVAGSSPIPAYQGGPNSLHDLRPGTLASCCGCVCSKLSSNHPRRAHDDPGVCRDPVTQSKRKSAVATAPKEPRLLSWRAEQVFWASNALLAHGHPVNPTLVRTLFNALHVLVEDRGNQWIGDALGGHG